MPQLAWFMVAFSGIAFVFGAARAAAEFGQIGLIRFLGLAATPSIVALLLYVWGPFPRLVPRSTVVVTGRVVLTLTCIFVFFGALFGVRWLMR